MMKKFTTLCLAAVMAVSMAACTSQFRMKIRQTQIHRWIPIPWRRTVQQIRRRLMTSFRIARVLLQIQILKQTASQAPLPVKAVLRADITDIGYDHLIYRRGRYFCTDGLPR